MVILLVNSVSQYLPIRLPLWERLNIASPNPEFAAAIERFTKQEGFKQSLLAAEFNYRSKDKERPNSPLFKLS
ncbi:MAG: hypothetical protein CMD99_03760 [Gammaproteobacteria bacterium]|nr:hypothetical protein [Gammaproteobacteria bacterium]